MNWTDGYVTDVSYTQGYYAELSPSRINLALLQAGHPPIPAGPVCELGFGQGISLVLNAAGHPERRFHGNDFNPAHVVHARALADAAAVSIDLSDQGFEEYCHRDDLPPFAFIALHGIWSWVSGRSREHIVEFLRRRLLPGGVVYVSYNVGAGWIGAGPLRELLYLHSERAQSPSVPTPDRARASLKFVERLMGLEAATVAQIPALKKRLDTLQQQDARYLAHEYLNANWHLTSFAEVAQELATAKLSYVGSSILGEQIAAVHLTQPQLQLLEEIPDQALRQTVRDFFTAQSFRRDVWVKGPVPYPPRELAARWASTRLVPTAPMADAPIKLRGSRGEATLPRATTDPLLSVLHDAAEPMTLAELQSRLRVKPAEKTGFANVLAILLASGQLDVARSAAEVEAAKPTSDAWNAAVMTAGQSSSGETQLVSPVTGVGIPQTRLALMFLAEVKAGAVAARPAVEQVARRLLERGEQLMFEGKPTADLARACATLEPVALELDAALPVLRRLGVL